LPRTKLFVSAVPAIISIFVIPSVVKIPKLTRNVAIDGVLPLKAARRDATANLKWFWGPQIRAT